MTPPLEARSRSNSQRRSLTKPSRWARSPLKSFPWSSARHRGQPVTTVACPWKSLRLLQRIVYGSAITHQSAITKANSCGSSVFDVARLRVSPVFLGVLDRSVLYSLESTITSRSRFELSGKPNSADGFLRGWKMSERMSGSPMTAINY